MARVVVMVFIVSAISLVVLVLVLVLMVMIFLGGLQLLLGQLAAGGRVETEEGVGLLEAGHRLGILRFLLIGVGGMLEAHQIGGRGLQLDHQLVAVEYQVEVAVTVLMGTVAVAFVFVVMGLGAEGGSGQQQGDCFHR